MLVLCLDDIARSADPSSVLGLQVLHHTSLKLGRKDICLAKAEIKISQLHEMCGEREEQKGEKHFIYSIPDLTSVFQMSPSG